MRRMRAQPDYYRTLGLTPSATPEEIRRAYRRLALEWHPDRNPGRRDAEERFKEISEAYAVLIDPAKRTQYDRLREGAGGPAPYRREELFRDLFANPDASSVFEELARELEQLGFRADRQDFYRTLFGGRAVVVGAVFVISPLTPFLALWNAARAALGTMAARAPLGAGEARTCPQGQGGGLGRVLHTAARWLLGLPAATAEADVVYPLRLTRLEAEHGARKRVSLQRADGREEVLVRIPAGVRSGTKLRLRGKGRRLPDGRAGDAYLVVEVEE